MRELDWRRGLLDTVAEGRIEVGDGEERRKREAEDDKAPFCVRRAGRTSAAPIAMTVGASKIPAHRHRVRGRDMMWLVDSHRRPFSREHALGAEITLSPSIAVVRTCSITNRAIFERGYCATNVCVTSLTCTV